MYENLNILLLLQCTRVIIIEETTHDYVIWILYDKRKMYKKNMKNIFSLRNEYAFVVYNYPLTSCKSTSSNDVSP